MIHAMKPLLITSISLMTLLAFPAKSAESWASQTVSDVDVRAGGGVYQISGAGSAYAFEIGADFTDFFGFKLQYQDNGNPQTDGQAQSVARFGVELGYNYQAHEYFAIKPFLETGSVYYSYHQQTCFEEKCEVEKVKETAQYYGAGVRMVFKYAYIEMNYKSDRGEAASNNTGVMIGVNYHL